MARGALKGLKRTRPSPGEKVVVKGQLAQGSGDRNSQGATRCVDLSFVQYFIEPPLRIHPTSPLVLSCLPWEVSRVGLPKIGHLLRDAEIFG